MLASKTPDPLHYGKYLENFTNHKRQPAHAIGNAPRFQAARSASDPGLGPGHFRVDRDFVENDLMELSPHCKTGVRVPPKYSIGHESRETKDGTLKGLAQGLGVSADGPAPGQYEMVRMNIVSGQKRFITHTVPKTKETAEALRQRKQKSDVPGPGIYTLARSFDGAGEKSKATERAVKRGTKCWAATQYSHIFSSMKPKRDKSALALLPSIGAHGSGAGGGGDAGGDPGGTEASP
jgi:hypothetical protein